MCMWPDAFGLLAFNAILLLVGRKAILTAKPTPLSSALRFLFKECKMHSRDNHIHKEESLCRLPLMD